MSYVVVATVLFGLSFWRMMQNDMIGALLFGVLLLGLYIGELLWRGR